MPRNPDKSTLLSLTLLAFSIVVTGSLFIWQGSKGFNLWDEGFLWYGAQRVVAGEVPIRDFMAYDPGRYYWSAALMALLKNDGILSLRAAVAVFQALGLFAGLSLIARSITIRSRDNLLYLLISALTLVAWMFPRHKLFDISLSIFLLGLLTALVRNPSARRYFLVGFGIGLVAVFGRNHGLYGMVSSFGVMVWLAIRRNGNPDFIRGFFLCSAGATVGFAPVLLAALFVPGFAAAFGESVRFPFEQKATNLPVPVPWPWTVDVDLLPMGDAVRGVLVGVFFIGILVFASMAVVWVMLQKFKGKPVPPALVAAAFMALPYAHFAYSRADVGHLAQSIFPLLVGSLVLLSNQEALIKWPLALGLCAASLWVMHQFHPGWQCRSGSHCVGVQISGSRLEVDPKTANDIVLLRRLAERHAANGRNFIAAPFWPGAYPLLNRKSPMWEIYALFPRPEAFERKEIARIQAAKPGFALILDVPLDRRDELRFRNTHPLTHQYILDHFDPLPNSPNPAYKIYKARKFER